MYVWTVPFWSVNVVTLRLRLYVKGLLIAAANGVGIGSRSA